MPFWTKEKGVQGSGVPKRKSIIHRQQRKSQYVAKNKGEKAVLDSFLSVSSMLIHTC